MTGGPSLAGGAPGGTAYAVAPGRHPGGGGDGDGGDGPGGPDERAARFRVFGLTWLSYASYYLTRKNFAVTKKRLQAEEGLATTELGWMDSGNAAAYAVGQFVWGSLADRVGYRRVLGFGMLATAGCSVAFGLSSSRWAFAMFWILNGLAQATGWAPNVKAMAAWFPAKGRGTVMGAWTSHYIIGSLAANPLATWALVRHGWRAAFFVPAAWVACVGVTLLFALPERAVPTAAAERARDRDVTRAARRLVLRNPMLWAAGVAYFFLKLTRYTLWHWLPFYTAELGYSEAVAGNLPLAFEIGGFVGAVGIGRLSDRFVRRRMTVAFVGTIFLAVALPVFAWAAKQGPYAYVAALALVGVLLFGPDALLSGAVPQDLGGPAAAATAAGFVNSVGSIGQILSGYLAARIAQAWGWNVVLLVLGGGALLAALAIAPFVVRRKPDLDSPSGGR